METFKQFLTESNPQTLKDIVSIIERNYAPFLKSPGIPLYRGMKSGEILTKHALRRDREPSDSSLEATEKYNNILRPWAGFNPRTEAVFVSPNRNVAVEYGALHLIIPIGDFKYVFIDGVYDLYSEIHDMVDGGERASEDEMRDAITPRIRTSGLQLEAGRRVEVMLHAPTYYAINLRKAQEEFNMTEREIIDTIFRK